MAMLHDFSPGDLVTYFRPLPGQTQRHIAEVIRTFPGKPSVRIVFYIDGEPKESTVSSESLEMRRDSQGTGP